MTQEIPGQRSPIFIAPQLACMRVKKVLPDALGNGENGMAADVVFAEMPLERASCEAFWKQLLAKPMFQ